MLVKKYSLPALLAILMLALFSCSKQQLPVQESELSLSLCCEQDFLYSKAGEGGTSADLLHYFVFDAATSDLLVSDQTALNASGTTNLKIRLFKDKEYVIAFWADNSASLYSISSATVSFPAVPAANDSNLDAFYSRVSVTGGQGSLNVTLKRAVAKLSISLSSSLAAADASSMSISSAYKTFSLLDGEVSNPDDLTFASSDCPDTQNVAYAYIFAPQDRAYSCTLSLKVLDNTGNELLGTTLNNIPLQRNIQTNITYNY